MLRGKEPVDLEWYTSSERGTDRQPPSQRKLHDCPLNCAARLCLNPQSDGVEHTALTLILSGQRNDGSPTWRKSADA